MEKFILHNQEAVLVIVDIQERLADVMSERKKVVDNCLHLIELCGLQGVPVILNEQYPKGLGPTVPELRDALKGISAHEKVTFSCCGMGSFARTLEATGRKKVVLVGMETHVCVLQTCIDLLKRGYIVHAVRDAICSRTTENHGIAMEYMRDAGAVVTCTEAVLFQLLEKAGSDEFKVISKRIK
ncbi:MAG: hydrolase [Nitrospirae bacterium]|nr:hydrolase [Nitrospirota bacterium]